MIRPFTPEDYPALARIASAAFPEYPSSAEEKEFMDTRRDPKCRYGRWLFERDGQPVGYGEYGQRSGAYHPRRFHIDVIVEPDWQGRGLGKALYDQVLSALALLDRFPCAPTRARTWRGAGGGRWASNSKRCGN